MKIKITLLTFIILSTILFANAQDSKRYTKLKRKFNYSVGYILLHDSSKVEGLVKEKMMNETRKFSAVTFVSKDGKKTTFFPYQIRGYGYSFYNLISDGSSFYETVKSGKKVSLYKNMSVNSWSAPGAPGMGGPMTYSTSHENLYVKKPGDFTFKLVKRRKFKEDFAEYFGDCESLKQKIENKELTHKDIKEIVMEYNSCS